MHAGLEPLRREELETEGEQAHGVGSYEERAQRVPVKALVT